ncbi:glutamine synthetase family protein [Faecalicoccus acidiformans]|uniref:glutamine synthetase family protein n=1 Tax=Faecalicoccus acidiformans TaxID=915173 RepID=UPI0023557D41|nr:glutamine synthetase family protein [Faecalicoccus acidiformans]
MYTKQDILDYVEEQNVTFIRLAYFDIFGKQKNISILPRELKRAFEEGISFDASAIDGFCQDVHSDLFLVPNPNTMAILPWRSLDGAVLRMYCDIQYPDGSPFELDTRYLLKKAMEKAVQKGYQIEIGSEFEFYLFLADEAGNNTYIPLDNAGYMDIAPEDGGEDVRKNICLTLEEMGLYPEASHHEEGPGQNEIDFLHSNPLRSADDAATFKWVVKTTAKANGLVADFSPKPLKEESGNGMHINISISDKNGTNNLTKSFMAGILRRLAEISLFLNPSPKSYERLGSFKAPGYVSWSIQNRSQAIRIPATRNQTKRIELRSPDCLANPYLAYLLLIEAGLEGVQDNLEPQPSVDVNLFEAGEEILSQLQPLPRNLQEASKLARSSDFVKRILPEAIWQAYLSFQE